jgi:hypothetical protein
VEENMSDHEPDREQAATPLARDATREHTRRRWSLGLVIYGILTALGGLALLVVE